MIAREDSDILLALGDTQRDGGAWDQVLQLLCAQLQATHITLHTEDSVHGDWKARPDCFAALRTNRVYSGEELTDRAGPFDPDFSAGDHRVIVSSTPQAWLWLQKARGSFRAVDSARLSALMPHFAQSLTLGRERHMLEQAFDGAQTLLFRAGFGRIGPSGPDATAQRLLADARHDPPAVEPGKVRTLSGNLSAYGLNDGTVLLRAARDLPAPDKIARALGLTPSEARLARSLAQGQSLPVASATLGLTRETGRSYAKQIYAKTGVSGQSGLICLIWRSALAFG